MNIEAIYCICIDIHDNEIDYLHNLRDLLSDIFKDINDKKTINMSICINQDLEPINYDMVRKYVKHFLIEQNINYSMESFLEENYKDFVTYDMEAEDEPRDYERHVNIIVYPYNNSYRKYDMLYRYNGPINDGPSRILSTFVIVKGGATSNIFKINNNGNKEMIVTPLSYEDGEWCEHCQCIRRHLAHCGIGFYSSSYKYLKRV